MEGYEVEFHGRQIQTQTQHTFQTAGIFGAIYDSHTPGHHTQFMKNRIVKGHTNPGNRIHSVNFQGVGFAVCIDIC